MPSSEEIKSKLIAKAQKASLLINPEALKLLESQENAEAVLDSAIQVAKADRNVFISLQIVDKAVRDLLEKSGAGQQMEQASNETHPEVEVRFTRFKPVAKDIEPDIQLGVNESDVTGRSRCIGKVDDFVAYFNDRFKKMKKILKQVSSADNPIKTIRQVKQAQGAAKIIAIINEKKPTKNGHLIMEVEDEEEYVNVLIPKDSPLMEEASTTYLDEVVAIDVYNSGKLFIAKGFTKPGKIVQEQMRKQGELDINLALISDMQIGSRFFEKEKFEKMMNFIKGKGGNEEEAGKIKYLTIAGDCADGIGVYPTQERELVIKDIYKQYEVICEYLKDIPEYIEVIIAPGNHDAVRLGEPQPKFADDLMTPIKGMKNIHSVGNPSTHKIHGFEILMYHGTTADALISNNSALKDGYVYPEKIGIEMLRRRHLMPLYGEDSMTPEAKDYMLIQEKPDIFHFGHVHKNGACVYNGTQVVNSGTWQGRTDFQARLGHHPTPCILPLYNFKSLQLTLKQF